MDSAAIKCSEKGETRAVGESNHPFIILIVQGWIYTKGRYTLDHRQR